MTDDIQVRPEDALQVAQRAMARINDLEDDVDDLRERLVELELRLSEVDENRSYAELTMDEKVGIVRERAYQMAAESHGRAALDYTDIRWTCFDGEPSESTAYRLLRRAAGYDNDGNRRQDVPGFELDENSRPMTLKVNAEAAKQSVAFFDRKNFGQEVDRSA